MRQRKSLPLHSSGSRQTQTGKVREAHGMVDGNRLYKKNTEEEEL